VPVRTLLAWTLGRCERIEAAGVTRDRPRRSGLARRHPGRDDVLEAWIARSRESFIAAYRAELGDRADLFDERIVQRSR
jgi:hypothetical protein